MMIRLQSRCSRHGLILITSCNHSTILLVSYNIARMHLHINDWVEFSFASKFSLSHLKTGVSEEVDVHTKGRYVFEYIPVSKSPRSTM